MIYVRRKVSLAGLYTAIFPIIASFIFSINCCEAQQNKQMTEFKYKYLSSEALDPFLRNGKKPILGVRWDAYARAAQKYSNVAQCLVEGEQNKTTPDLRLIDWPQLRSGPELDICLFRIFSSIGSVKGVVDWMDHHKINTRISMDEEWDPSYQREILLTVVGGIYNSRTYGPLASEGVLIEWTIGLLWPVYSENLTVYMRNDGSVFDVRYAAAKI